MNRARLNLLLLVIVLALGVGARMAYQKKNKPKALLTPIAAEGVSKIVVEWPGSDTITLEKKDAEWWLTSPVQGRADRFEATGATSLASTEVQGTVEGEDINLKELGLDPPGHAVTLNDIKVEFGGSDPLQSRRYVRVGGAIKLIEDPATAALDKDYADLVAKDLFAPNDELIKIELPDLTLSKAEDGSWTAPVGTANATPSALKALAEGWKGARAMWNEASPGEAMLGTQVRITTKAGAVTDYVVASLDPQFALYSPTLKVRHQLSKALADELLKLPAPPAAADSAKP
ncbi:MAG: DUF4340 domain-containing protein [Pseudomonadota bacterium]